MFLEQANREERIYADRTNPPILEQMNREEKKTTLSVFNLLIKSLESEL